MVDGFCPLRVEFFEARKKFRGRKFCELGPEFRVRRDVRDGVRAEECVDILAGAAANNR